MTVEEVQMWPSAILVHMENGAKLRRRLDQVELLLSDGRTLKVQMWMLIELINACRIVPEYGERRCFYRLA